MKCSYLPGTWLSALHTSLHLQHYEGDTMLIYNSELMKVMNRTGSQTSTFWHQNHALKLKDVIKLLRVEGSQSFVNQ